ncbi:hypothetical protein AB0L82_14300 [Nocardia sp. NPDC052001]|uniref:hypothetical protein n=1 Tax=Nocardia sp. NPDC052001 TaxID=3154853 RepID=UPI0034241B99
MKAQAQNESDAPDPTVEISPADPDLPMTLHITRIPASTSADGTTGGRVTAPWRDPSGSTQRGVLLESIPAQEQ